MLYIVDILFIVDIVYGWRRLGIIFWELLFIINFYRRIFKWFKVMFYIDFI